MKQFTRRTSQKAQLDVEKRAEECHDKAEDQPQSNCTKVLQGAVAEDPYSFDFEDDTAAQAKLAKVSKLKELQARQGVKQHAQASTSAATQPASKPAAQPPPADLQPGPPKQPQPAGAQHVASSATHKEALPDNRKAATARDTQQKPLPPSKAPATAETTARPAFPPPAPAVRTASEGSRRAAALLAQRPGSSGGRQNSGGFRNKGVPSSSNPTSSKSASSGGARKPAAVGSKRGRGVTETAESQQQQQQFSNSDPPGSVSGAFRSPDPAASTSGAISLPTPHRRPRQISAGLLAAAAAAAGGAEARAAQTVMEAQERGELVQMQDEASYALGGMGQSCSTDTQRDSAVTITEMLSTRKGRTALRSDGLAQQFLTNLAKLKAGKDCVLGLAATLSLWYLTADDANPCFLASTAAAVLLDQLLQVDFTFEEVAAKGAAGSKLCRLVRVRPLATLLSTTGVSTSRGLLLVTLEQATSSQHASKAASVEKLKHNLRQFGALQRLAALVTDTAAAPGGPVAASKQLHLLLLVLENATFTCPDNGTALSQLQICPGSKGGPCKPAKPQQQQQQRNGAGEAAGQAGPGQEQQQAFPAVLVGVAQQLLQGVDSEQPRAALHALLSFMMNLIHNNKQGGALLCSQGGMAVAADTYSRLLQPSAGSQETLCAAVLQQLELVSASLGVLMNLVSNEPQHSRQLAAAGAGDAAAADGSNSSGSSGDVSSFVRLLCTVMTALGQLLKHHLDQESADPAAADATPAAAAAAAAGGGAGSSVGLPSGAKVVTSPSAAAEALGSNTASEASIVEVYSGILLGFLVRDGGPELAAAVAGLLPGGSLDPLTSATGRCLDFYVRTGAITDHTKATLQALLQQLTELKAGLSGGCDGGGGGGGGAEQGSHDPDVMIIE